MKIIGYHGTNNLSLDFEGIDDNYGKFEDHFLGRGFYLFRDSKKRAYQWAKNRYKNSVKVLEVEIEIEEEKILNFTSTNWEGEVEIIELFVEVCNNFNIFFGDFLDFLIDEIGIEIAAIMVIDLKTKNYFIPIQAERKLKTLFAFGDIQVCIKDKRIIKSVN